MGLLEIYHRYNTEQADVRTNDWMFVGSPWALIAITVAYLYYILDYGPKHMQNRPAYKLRGFIRLYNVFQIVTNTLIVYQLLDNGWYQESFFYCTEMDYSTRPRSLKFTRLAWYILILKVIDYIETVLFVLRKKQRQISFLHVYHHVTTVFLAWITVKYYAMSETLTVALINCSVHVLMYFYYLLSSFGPSIQKCLAQIKPLITIVQMVQFVIIFLHVFQALYPGCPGLEKLATIAVGNVLVNFVLFYNFYRENYTKKGKQT